MKRKRISEALEHLDPAYIDEAAGFTAVHLYQKPFFRLAAAAACLIVCATAVLLSNVFDQQTPPVDTPPVSTTVTHNATSADTTVTTTTTATIATVTTSTTTEPSATVTTSTKKGRVPKGTKTTRTVTTTTKRTYLKKATTTKIVATKPSTTAETITTMETTTAVTSTTARKDGDLPIPPRDTTTDQSSLPTKITVNRKTTPHANVGTTTCDPSTSVTTKSTSTRPTRPHGSFGEMEFRTDVQIQLDKSVYTPDETITVTIENTSADTLYLYSLIFWATQTENGEWSRGWGSTPLSFTTSVLEPGETCTATKRLSLSPDKTYALALCVGDTWIRSDTFRVNPTR